MQQLAVWGSLKFRLFYAEPVRNYAGNEDEAQLSECVYTLYSNLQDLSNEISPLLVGIVLIMTLQPEEFFWYDWCQQNERRDVMDCIYLELCNIYFRNLMIPIVVILPWVQAGAVQTSIILILDINNSD